MPRRSFARRPVVASRGRSGTNWFRVIDSETAVAEGTKVLLASGVLSNAGINEVVRRTRGRILITSDQATIVENVMLAFGMIVVSDLALAAGAASIPGPITDASDDGWFVWEGFPTLVSTTDGSTSFAVQYYGEPFDSKAMRRIPEGFGVAFMAEATGGGAEVALAISVLTSRA